MNKRDNLPNRYGTGSVKWDLADDIFQQEGVLPLWVADMDFPAPQPVVNALVERARHGIYGYSACGEGWFRETVSWQERRHGWEISPASILFVPGVVPALNMLVQEFVAPGEKVIIQPPVYYPFRGAVKNNGALLLENCLIEDEGHYRMDLGDLREKASDPGVAMMILCSPHNPVGRVWEKEVLQEVVTICRENNILLVSDEIHADLTWPGKKHCPTAAAVEDTEKFLITCSSPSKTFNLPGLQAAYAVIADGNLRERFRKRLERNGIHGPSCFGALAQETAYREGEPWLREVMERIEGNFLYLKKRLEREEPRIGITVPEATYLVWLDFRFLNMDKIALRELVRHGAGVALDDGYIFGTGGEGFQRINIACGRELLEKALDRILEAVKKVEEE